MKWVNPGTWPTTETGMGEMETLEWLRSVGSEDLEQEKRYSHEIRGSLGGFLFSFSISVSSTGLDMLKYFWLLLTRMVPPLPGATQGHKIA